MIYSWSNIHSAFISRLFIEFKAQGIRYFVLRNYDELPENNSGKDVDIVISPGTYNKVNLIIKVTMQCFNIRYCQVSKF